MNIRPKEKVTAVFRRLFKSSNNKEEGPSKPSGSVQGSPARRLLRSKCIISNEAYYRLANCQTYLNSKFCCLLFTDAKN